MRRHVFSRRRTVHGAICRQIRLFQRLGEGMSSYRTLSKSGRQKSDAQFSAKTCGKGLRWNKHCKVITPGTALHIDLNISTKKSPQGDFPSTSHLYGACQSQFMEKPLEISDPKSDCCPRPRLPSFPHQSQRRGKFLTTSFLSAPNFRP